MTRAEGYAVRLEALRPRLFNLPPSDPRPPLQNMSPFSWSKKHSKSLSASSSFSGFGSSQVSLQQQFPTNSELQSHFPSPRENQMSPPLFPWSSYAPKLVKSPSPFPRGGHALSTTTTATGELVLFGGYVPGSGSASKDLYLISTRDFSITRLKTSGDVPSPRHGHRAVLTGTTLLIWGGETDSGNNTQGQGDDDSIYLLNLGTLDLFECQDPRQLIRAFFVPESRKWARIKVPGPGPGSRHHHTMTLIGSKLFVFGGKSPELRRSLNDIWALDLNSCTFAACFPDPF